MQQFDQHDETPGVAEGYAAFVLDAFGAAPYELDLLTATIHPSPRLNALLGFPADHPLTVADEQARVHPDDRTTTAAAVADTATRKEPRFQCEYRISLPDGHVRWLLSRGEVVFDAAGRPALVRGAVIDITEREQAEAALRSREAHNAFLLQLDDRLRPLADPEAIQFAAASALGEHLGASRVGYAENQADGETIVVTHNYTNGAPDIVGRYRYDDFGPALLREFLAGRTVVRPDITNDPTLTDVEKAAHAALQLGATVNVPLLKAGRLLGVLFMHERAARSWSAEELALVEAVAARTWDAVERARAETALRESEERYRTVLDNIDQGFARFEMVYDEHAAPVDYRFLEVNHTFERHTGLRDALGKTARELVPNLEAHWFAAYGQVAQSGETLRFEQGSVAMGRLFEVEAVRVGAAERRQVAVIFTDVTERRGAEMQLAAAAARDQFRVRLADALRPLSDPVEIEGVAVRLLGEQLGANRVAYFEVLGADYVVERDYVAGVSPISGRFPIASFGPKLLAGLRAGRPVVAPDVKADPELSPVEQAAFAAIQIGTYVSVPLIKGERFVAGLAVHSAAARSWTPDEVALIKETAERTWAAIERARAQAALRESEAQFRLMADAVPQIVWFTDADGRMEFFNKQWSAYTGVTYESTTAADAAAHFMHPDDGARVLAAFNEARRSGGVFAVEHRIRSAAGEYRWFLVRAEPYRDPQSGAVVRWFGASIDIHDRKLAEARLEQLYAQEQTARAQAEEASRLKDEFLATVSHELRTPLTAFLGYAELLQRRTRDEAYVRRAVEKMRQSAQTQAALIEDLLDVSQIVSGRLRIEPEPIELTDVVYAALDTVRPTVEAKGLQLEVELDSAASAVLGDANRLQQVVWNLLANAAKFTPAGGRIAVRLARDGRHAELRVRDTGQGIHPDFLPYVFERFRQADSTSQRAYGGLGLGLAIVRHLVELHGGTVAASSAGLGQGATFTLRLPLAEARDLAREAVSATADAAATAQPLPLRGLRALVVDDQPAILELLEEMLVFDGALVRTCPSAREALALVRGWRPDVLVSDIAMPDEDGYWLIQQVRSLPPEEGGATPAVALTAYVRIEDRLRVLAAGFQQYVPKPVNPAELRDVIAQLVATDLEG